VPPPQKHHAAAMARLEDYKELTRDFGLTIQAAATRLQISRRTAGRYETRLNGSEQAVNSSSVDTARCEVHAYVVSSSPSEQEAS
jgi:hypothetical protein